MNREIKFRGKRIDNGEWIYGDLLNYGNYTSIRYNSSENYVPQYLEFPVIPESVGQLWKPTHGLEVYTGDLLMATCSPSGSDNKKQRICKVQFGHKGMDIAVLYKNSWWAYQSMNLVTAKIIGNIIDNPELLGEITERGNIK